MMAVVPPKKPPAADQSPSADQPPAADQSRPAGPPPGAAPPEPDRRPVLPQRSSDETDAGWGERPEPDDDERLRQDRPPHYDR
jgi:hypothetical protein